MKRILTLLAAAILAAPCLSLAAVANDEVTLVKLNTSVKLKEDDNNGSQDTNTGNGVKTNHLQNKALTGAKMADGTITATQLANGAVTDAKIGGLIPFSKLPTGTTSSTVAVGNHTHDTAYLAKSPYAHVVVVAKNGTATGPIYSNLQSAVDAASAAIPAGARALVKVMPGVYDLVSATLQMRPNVDLEGSGAETTVIRTSNVNPDQDTCALATVRMAADTAIRDVQLINLPPTPNDFVDAVGLSFPGIVAKADRVTIRVGRDTVDGGKTIGVCVTGTTAHAILNDIYVETRNLPIAATNRSSDGIQVAYGASLTLTNSRLVSYAFGDVYGNLINTAVGGGTITVSNSVLELHGQGYGLWADGVQVTVANSMILIDSTLGANVTLYGGTGPMTVVGTQVHSNVPVTYSFEPSYTWRIAGSLVPGDRSGLAGATMVGCYDETFAPIANTLSPVP